MEAQLCSTRKTKQDIASDENRDRLCCSTHDGSNASKNTSANEPITSTKDIRQAAYWSESDSQGGIINEGNPCISRIGPNIGVDGSKKGSSISLYRQVSYRLEYLSAFISRESHSQMHRCLPRDPGPWPALTRGRICWCNNPWATHPSWFRSQQPRLSTAPWSGHLE